MKQKTIIKRMTSKVVARVQAAGYHVNLKGGVYHVWHKDDKEMENVATYRKLTEVPCFPPYV